MQLRIAALLVVALALAGTPGAGPAFARSGAAVSADIAGSKLPPEARDTLALIRRGGPFPYRQDGSIFGNRERLLPAHEHGYYREYTVPTPGANDRGARRIVAGGDVRNSGEYYYSDDHYNSFRRIRE